MTDIEVVELSTATPVLLAYETPDPLDGAEIISVSSAAPPGGGSLEHLADVDLAGAQTGQPLVRGPDGVWRPGQFPENQRGSVISLTQTTPTALTAAHRDGDYIIAFGDPGAPIYQVEDT